MHSVITDHRIISDRDFDWNNVEILDRNFNKRLIFEMIKIKSQIKDLNLIKRTRIRLTGLAFRASRILGCLLFIIHYISFIIYYYLFRPCQNKTVTFAFNV